MGKIRLFFGTFKVGHIGPDVAVEGIDNHLAIRRSGDLDSSVDEARCWRSTFPGIIVTDMLGLGKEIGQIALVNLLLADYPSLQKGFPCAVESSVEEGEESGGFGGKDLAERILDGAIDGDAFVDGFNRGHCDDLGLRFQVYQAKKCIKSR